MLPTKIAKSDATMLSTACMEQHEDPDTTRSKEKLREFEYPQLKERVYLDHGGTTLYAKSCIENWSADMTSNLYGNPHSDSTPSALAGQRIEAIRGRTLRFFKADPRDWDLVFVSNATAAIKLVGECLRDNAAATKRHMWYGYHKDAHTSLVGVRELAKSSHCFTGDTEVDKWIAERRLEMRHAKRLELFSYPGQSNMTGRRLPLRWPGQIRKASLDHQIYTLLDAAALASTAALDLSHLDQSPDFVALSFYKIFGWPNIGALLVQKRSHHVLEKRKFFGGGTVDMVIAVGDRWHAKKDMSLHDRLEDGTLPFHSVFALDHAMDAHERLYGPDPMRHISTCTAQLSKIMYDALMSLRHSNGYPLVHMYKDKNADYGDAESQGATIAMNVLRADSTVVRYAEVEAAADRRDIFVRSGSLCNPGGVATYLGWSPSEMRAAFHAGHRCSNPIQTVLGKPTGVVRVSLGAMSIITDVHAFVGFVRDTYSDTRSTPMMIEAEIKVSAVERPSSLSFALRTVFRRRSSGRNSCSAPTEFTQAWRSYTRDFSH